MHTPEKVEFKFEEDGEEDRYFKSPMDKENKMTFIDYL